MIELAKETGMVLVVPIYEKEDEGFLYNTAAVIDADGTYLGKYRKTHIPQVKGFWEKFYFRPGNMGYPIFDTAVGRIGVYICYDRHFPEGWRALGLAGAKIVFNPSATSRGLSMYLWNLEQPAAAVANEYFIGAINRVGQGAVRRQRLLRLVVLRRSPRPDRRRRRPRTPTRRWSCATSTWT
jgi:beta-ureidopropionase